jgi:hypothetical protein
MARAPKTDQSNFSQAETARRFEAATRCALNAAHALKDIPKRSKSASQPKDKGKKADNGSYERA